jgi:hypothetical protein
MSLAYPCLVLTLTIGYPTLFEFLIYTVESELIEIILLYILVI